MGAVGCNTTSGRPGAPRPGGVSGERSTGRRVWKDLIRYFGSRPNRKYGPQQLLHEDQPDPGSERGRRNSRQQATPQERVVRLRGDQRPELLELVDLILFPST